MIWVLIIGFGVVLSALAMLGRDVQRISDEIGELRREIVRVQDKQKVTLEFMLDAVDEFAILHDEKNEVAGSNLSERLLAVRESIRKSLS